MIRLDPESSDSPFEQVRAQITAQVIAGGLRPGDRLPSIRQLAGDLGLATGTVARAYRELENDGVVRGRGARGTAIVGPPQNGVHGRLLDAATVYAQAAARLGASLDDAVCVLRVAFAAPRDATDSEIRPDGTCTAPRAAPRR